MSTRPKPNIIEVVENPKLFAPLFGSDLSSWSAWLVFLKALFGVTMDPGELELFQKCTARAEPPKGGAKEAWCIVGRRGGKSRIVSFVAVFLGCFFDFSKQLARGETAMVLTLARDRDQSRVTFNYIRAIIESIPVLNAMVTAWRADEIQLNNGVTIGVKTADFRGIRGVTVVCAICDEMAFWDAIGTNTDTAILQAIRPAQATLKESKLLVISSPYAKFGALFQAYKDYYGRDGAPALIWQAATRVMNPLITQEFIDQEMARDPESGRSEWLADFRDDLEAAFSLEAIEACIVRDRDELPATSALRYVAFADPSGGLRDSFTLSVAHREGDSVVVDLLRAWKPKFNPSEVVAEIAEVLHRYGVVNLSGDAYAGEWPSEQFRTHGISYEKCRTNKSELFLGLIPIINARRIELPDSRPLVEEMVRLERRRGRSGKDLVDHPPGAHDDLSNSLAGCSWMLLNEDDLGVVNARRFLVEGCFYDHIN